MLVLLFLFRTVLNFSVKKNLHWVMCVKQKKKSSILFVHLFIRIHIFNIFVSKLFAYVLWITLFPIHSNKYSEHKISVFFTRPFIAGGFSQYPIVEFDVGYSIPFVPSVFRRALLALLTSVWSSFWQYWPNRTGYETRQTPSREKKNTILYKPWLGKGSQSVSFSQNARGRNCY